jgi:hypothetical protein
MGKKVIAWHYYLLQTIFNGAYFLYAAIDEGILLF